MITHVKKNSQKLRTAYIKPSRIEAAVQFRKKTLFSTHIHNPKNSKQNNRYSKEREVQVSELNKYIRKMERIYDSFPYFPF